jgi:hypothetical protein
MRDAAARGRRQSRRLRPDARRHHPRRVRHFGCRVARSFRSSGIVTLGRGSDAAIRIDEPWSSRLHAALGYATESRKLDERVFTENRVSVSDAFLRELCSLLGRKIENPIPPAANRARRCSKAVFTSSGRFIPAIASTCPGVSPVSPRPVPRRSTTQRSRHSGDRRRARKSRGSTPGPRRAAAAARVDPDRRRPRRT